MKKPSRNDVRSRIAEKIAETELTDKRISELLELLAEEKLAENYLSDIPTTFSERCADSLARFAGSWAFIIAFSATMLVWITLNVLWLAKAFDPYPFILLNLILSCISALQSPIIMMSQNREAKRDRERSQNAYRLALKSELLLEAMHRKLDSAAREREKK